MKLAIMQPYFFPYIGYFQLIAAVDKFIAYDQLAYIKNGWIHRNRIAAGDADVYFGVSVLAKSSHRLISEIAIDHRSPWQAQLATRLRRSYGKSPHFPKVFAVLEPLLHLGHDKIADLNYATLVAVSRLLGIETEMVRGGPGYPEIEVAVRANPSPSRRKLERMVSICQLEGAEVFVNAIGGTALYRREDCAAHGIDLKFIAIEPEGNPALLPPYRSIIDTLFGCGIEGTRELLHKYRLV